MPRLETISCDVKGCTATHTEEAYGKGHLHWGGVMGIQDDKTGAPPELCPEHLQVVVRYMTTGGANAMD